MFGNIFIIWKLKLHTSLYPVFLGLKEKKEQLIYTHAELKREAGYPNPLLLLCFPRTLT